MSKHAYYLVAGLVKILAGIIPVFIILQFLEAKYFIKLGAVAWAFGVSLKWLWAVPFHEKTIEWIIKRFSASKIKLVSFIYSGMLTGITECGMTLYFIYKYHRLFGADYNSAVAFGVGFGSFEAIICGLGTIIPGIVIFFQKYVKTSNDETACQNYKLVNCIVFPFSERIFASLIHTFSCVLTILAVQKENYCYFTFAFMVKFICDGHAQLLHLEKKQSPEGNVSSKTFWIFEICLISLALVSLTGLIILY